MRNVIDLRKESSLAWETCLYTSGSKWRSPSTHMSFFNDKGSVEDKFMNEMLLALFEALTENRPQGI